MTQPEPKYVSASKPVNRRTATVQSQPERVNPLLQERMQAKWASQQSRTRFGLPLAEQLELREQALVAPAVSPLFIAGGVLAAVSAVVLLLAAIEHSLWWAGSGVLGLAAGAVVMVSARRSHASAARAEPAASPLFEGDSLLAFDRALASLAADVPEPVMAALMNLKQQIVRINALAAGESTGDSLSIDDRLYLNELLRRYLPDSLQAFLTVPGTQRSEPLLANGETAVTLVLGQISLLCAEVAQRERKLKQGKAEALLRQQRFLESKRSR